jgi:hypothetical protein
MYLMQNMNIYIKKKPEQIVTLSSLACLAFHINSKSATTNDSNKPTANTTNTPPTLARPSSVAESLFLSSELSHA